MSNLKEQVKETLWTLIEKHYNVNRQEPNMLLAKNPFGRNPIDQIGEDLSILIEHILASVPIAEETSAEEEGPVDLNLEFEMFGQEYSGEDSLDYDIFTPTNFPSKDKDD